MKFRVFLMAGSCLVVVGKYAMTFIDAKGCHGKKTTKMLPSGESKSGSFVVNLFGGKWTDRLLKTKLSRWAFGTFLGGFVKVLIDVVCPDDFLPFFFYSAQETPFGSTLDLWVVKFCDPFLCHRKKSPYEKIMQFDEKEMKDF